MRTVSSSSFYKWSPDHAVAGLFVGLSVFTQSLCKFDANSPLTPKASHTDTYFYLNSFPHFVFECLCTACYASLQGQSCLRAEGRWLLRPCLIPCTMQSCLPSQSCPWALNSAPLPVVGHFPGHCLACHLKHQTGSLQDVSQLLLTLCISILHLKANC